MPLAQVYGVATFYSQFHLRPRGDTVVQDLPRHRLPRAGAPEVTRAVTEELGVKVGETTEDLAFTLESVACVGCCGLAPVMLVDEKTLRTARPVEARRIAATLREEAAIARGEVVLAEEIDRDGRSQGACRGDRRG